jgi:GNAT superfamily N-acetyltransferase
MPNFIDNCIFDLNRIIGVSDVKIEHHLNGGRTKPLHIADLIRIDDDKKYVSGPHSFIIEHPHPLKKEINQPISDFKLIAMPHCNGMCISVGSYVDEKFRGKGIGTRLNQFRQDLAKHIGYSVLICTDDSSNEPQKKLLKKNNWQDIFRFKNQISKNMIDISVKNLYDDRDKPCKVCSSNVSINATKCWWCETYNPVKIILPASPLPSRLL